MKKSVSIVADTTIINKYKIQSFLYFKNIGDLGNYTFANYANHFIPILELYFKDKFKTILVATKEDIKFFRSNKKRINVPDKYIINETAKLTLLLESNIIDKFYNIMNTYYKFEASDFTSSYSFSMFIVDVLELMECFISE